MNKYEERVKQRAEEMAALIHGEKDMSAFETKNEWISLYTPLARLSVQREAEAVQMALEPNHKQDYIDRLLEILGLIPPQTHTT